MGGRVMAENLFPLFLRLSDRPCLLIGGQGEATRKGETLLAAGARLRILAEILDPPLAEAVRIGRAEWLRGGFEATMLDGVWLVVSDAPDEALNARLYAACQERGIWLNVVDQPDFCTVIWPAVVERSPVTVAITTAGRSPALAGYLRRRIASVLPERLGALAERLAAWRREVPGGLAARGAFWKRLLDGGVAERFLDGDEAGAERMVREALRGTLDER
ncbi:MAG: bifunctional precorrin-2 dehydrogenase/sirohydrochlorin ferrochelatase [Magnetococcales bacterium]|nr:bifunctional precorrin-2 dehydrogenase/sirohydrochlorin ferrochelatase [Magnetococcales bacterium]